ncbi:MAG: hypothetical protein F6K04_25140 [Leptolyngbya sp. SIO4C5]|nr:hypothetical protein [Leptolyngbya sp. SIO4C5]
MGPAVIPVQSYILNPLSLDAPDLPLGYDLGRSSYSLLPSYRSGTVVRVGTEATVLLRGVVVDAEGDPVALQRGTLISISDPDWPVIELFTNRAGRFAASGLKPGRYRLQIFGTENKVVELIIPEQTSGLFEAGILSLPATMSTLQN